VRVPACARAVAKLSNFSLNNADIYAAPLQQTSATLCHDGEGLHLTMHADDAHVFSPWHDCNADVFSRSDVLEAFVAPVLDAHDAPQQYFELDTAPTGALFGALVGNAQGNASTPVANPDATGEPVCAPGASTGNRAAFQDCLLPCTGTATFPSGVRATASTRDDGFDVRLTVPWTLFAARFRPAGGKPWPSWRLNVYRYDYPSGPDANYTNFELSAWSPTHSGTFHVPSAFGHVLLEA